MVQRIVVAAVVLALLAGCSGRDEQVEIAEIVETPAMAPAPAKKRLSGIERRRIRDAQDEFGKGFDLLWGKRGVHDKKQAHVHLLRAAELGHARSQGIVGVNYQKGRGTKKDLAEAIRWWKISAETGWGHAQLKLGAAYRDGRGVEKDRVEALQWLVLSGHGGSIAGGMIAPSYAASLPPTERQEGVERARAWRIEHGLGVWKRPEKPDAAGRPPVPGPTASAAEV